MKKIYNKVIATVGLVAICTTAAEATPAFARQMNADCMTCHYQNIPKLNSFGREFKLSGFTMTGGVKEIVSEANGGLALPSTLNFGFVTKARVHNTQGNAGKTEIFDEAAFIFGGKVAENVGVSMEFGEGLIGGKFIFSKQTSAGRIGLTYFMTDALGVFSGLEVQSTGLYRPVRQFENRKRANIFQNLGVGSGEATGFQAYYSGNGLTATVGQYAPVFANSASTGTVLKTFARASYEMSLGGFNVALGAYNISGDVSELVTMNTELDDNNVTVLKDKVHSVNTAALDLESTGFDAQIEGDLSGMPLMLTAGYVLDNTHGTTDMTGFSTAVQVNPTDTVGVKAAFLSTTDNTTGGTAGETSMSVGTDYMYAQNVRLCLEVSSTSYDKANKDDSMDTIFMTMIAF